jgi:para-nitrobenzyl esterase
MICTLIWSPRQALALAAAVLFLYSTTIARAADDPLVVTTKSGQVRGTARPSGGAEFLGIPYAQPPVGDLRWHEPLPAKPWSGVRDTATFGAPCAQPVLGDWNRTDAEASKEDCLFLNVITPVWPAKTPLPVMFWLHGGANEGGTASSSLYKDGTLVQHGVLLVTVNYRLGVFGFFAHPALTAESAHHSSGNYGLADQALALRWVVDNIAKFGGDPTNITVFGQSAGAMDTGMLMASSVKDLFQKAIAESGSPIYPPLGHLTDAEQAGERLATALKAPAGDAALPFLRKIPPQDLIKALADQGPGQAQPFRPVIDGWLITRSPIRVFSSGDEAQIPLLIGTTTREFGWPSGTADQVRTRIQTTTGEQSPKVLAAYGLADAAQPADDPLYGTAADQWAADALFRCPSTTEAAWHYAAHHPTYEYEFEHAIPGQEAEGAVHSADLPYVFGFFPKSGNIAGKFGEIDTKLADLMETYWTNFAKTGNPNADKLPAWPQFGDSRTYLIFKQDGSVTTAAGLRSRQCDVLREVAAARLKQMH